METMKSAHDCARNTLKTTLKRMKRNYDLRLLQRPYVIYFLDTASMKGKSRKLSVQCKGPAVIVKKLSAHQYRVKLRNAVFVMNHDRMMPCKARKVPEWITKFKRS